MGVVPKFKKINATKLVQNMSQNMRDTTMEKVHNQAKI